MSKISKEIIEEYIASHSIVRMIKPAYTIPSSDDFVMACEPPSSCQSDSHRLNSRFGSSGSYIPKDKLEELLETKSKKAITFQDFLRTKMMEKNLSDPDVYKPVNMDPKQFNKIKNQDSEKSISLDAAIMIGLGLKLDLTEMDKLLRTTGRSFSDSKRNLIIKCYIETGNYNINDLNKSLYEFNKKLLGQPKEDIEL